MNKNSLLWLTVMLLFVGIGGYWSYHHEQEMQTKAPPQMNVQQKKGRFIALMVPAVSDVYQRLLRRYVAVEEMLRTGVHRQRIIDLKQEYGVASDAELLAAIKPHPCSITLAQAALESNWATSRFFMQANNVFGIWSFDAGEPRLAAGKKRGTKTIWVKKYSSIQASIEDYYRLLGRGGAFAEFRREKMVTDDPFRLIQKLDHYSERGAAYCSEVALVLKHNNFTRYD